MIMDVCLVDVRTDNVGVITLCEALCQLAAQTVRLLRRDLTGTEGLAQMIGNHIIRTTDTPGVSDVLLFGKQELTVSDSAVTLPAGNQSAVVGFSRIFHIVNDCGNCGSGSAAFSNVQRHEPCGCHELPSL